MLLYVGFFVTTLVDAFWIFKGEKINRLVDVFAKTDVLNESQNKL
jgi:ADP-dependent phosphofructokinase/glucokinase